MCETECWEPSNCLPGKNIPADDLYDWDVEGHELVSRVLTAPAIITPFRDFRSSNAVQEIKSYLDAMHGTPNDPYGVYVNKSCGLHIHVARSPENDSGAVISPLPVLQHLAYILVQYEDIISSLHHPCRRDLLVKDNCAYAGSNLVGLRRSGHSCLRHPLVDLAKAQRKIFAKNMTPERLAKLMDTSIGHLWSPADVRGESAKKQDFYHTSYTSRYKFVNFDRVQDPTFDKGAKTIEFRQHTGTVDWEEVAHWVHFVLSLVKLAERRALQDEPASLPLTAAHREKRSQIRLQAYSRMPFTQKQGYKYHNRKGKLLDQLEELFGLLEFDAYPRNYWAHKFLEYNPKADLNIERDESGAERAIAHKDKCIACDWEKSHKLHCDDCKTKMHNGWKNLDRPDGPQDEDQWTHDPGAFGRAVRRVFRRDG